MTRPMAEQQQLLAERTLQTAAAKAASAEELQVLLVEVHQAATSTQQARQARQIQRTRKAETAEPRRMADRAERGLLIHLSLLVLELPLAAAVAAGAMIIPALLAEQEHTAA